MFIHDRLGRRKDATGAIVDLIRVASSSGMGSTHLIGHELGHNLMSIARDAGVITEAQQKELDALFTDKNGKFDEEAFAEAFARELKRAFFETVQKRMEDVPPTKAGRALRRVADFIVTLAKSFAFWRQERGLDPVTGQPLQAGQVLDAFLKRERTAVDEATQVANAARAAETRATQGAMANAPTQTVVDEDGTEVAYHEAERGDRDVTAQDFARTFGMYAPYSFAERSDDDTDFDLNKIQFDGVAKEVAQAQANGAYDGLMAIAKVMGVPPDTLGLGGLISPNFGATHSNSGTRGFYLPARGELVLPTTVTWEQVKDNRRMLNVLRWWLLDNARNDLAKSTAIHEWMHALDMALASGRDADWRNEGAVEDGDVRARDPKTGELGGAILEPRALSFPNGRGNNVGYPISDSVRPEVRAAFDRMMGAIMDSSYGKRQANAKEWLEQYKDEIAGDVKSTAENLSKPNEVLARAFEQVIAEESGSIGARKYFETAYENPDMADALAYPTSDEVRELLPIFREFFSALEVGVNETTGVDTLYHDPEGRTRYEWENWTREEKLERIRATNDIHIVTPIEGDEAELLAKYLEKAEGHKKDIVDWALNEQNRIVSAINTNAFIGNIKTSGNSIRSILSHGSGPLKVLVLRHLDEILTNAVPYRIGKGKKEGRTFINLAHRLSFDGREHIAYVSILEDRNGNRTYDVEFGSEERLLRELPNGPAARNESEADADSRNTNSIAQSGEDVKSDPNEERRDHISDGSGVSPEMDEVRRQYEGTEQWMKAPNGKPTRLNERQWLQVRTPSFKAWFGDWENDPANASKVVDENGEPLVVYHGSENAGFTVFDSDYWDEDTIGNFASSEEEIAGTYSGTSLLIRSDMGQGKRQGNYALFLNIRNPLIVDAQGNYWDEIPPENRDDYVGAGELTDEQLETLAERAGVDEELERDEDGELTWQRRNDLVESVESAYAQDVYDGDGWPTGETESPIFNSETLEATSEHRIADSTRKIANRTLKDGTGYDGVIFRDIVDIGPHSRPFFRRESDVFVTKEGVQLKSATDNVGTFSPDNVDIQWHESEGGASLRFTETPLGQELVAEAFDVIVGSRVDLLLRPSRYYGNPYETAKRNPRDGLVVEKLGREIDVSEPGGFAAEVSAEISRFGTREGDPTLREIRARCGSKARFYEVLGAVYETAEAVRSGLAEVVTGRERAMMENAGLQAADFIKHNATARATALGRKLYLMGREFAWKLYKEDIAAARAEAQAKVREANAKTREAKAQTRNAERREETARNQAYQNRWGLAEERFMREYERALLRHQAARKVSDVREKMQEQVDLLRLREARKRALERERGVTFTALKATLGVDIPARLRALAGTQEDPFEAAAKLIAEIDDGFDKWVKRDRRDLLGGTEPYTYLNEQGERAYAETMGNVLKAVARDLSYGKLREALVNAADKIAREKHDTVRVIVEGKLGRVARVLRLAQNADIVTLANRRIKSALAEANKRLSSANSGMRTRYMAAMRKQAKELIKTMQLAVSAQDNTKASEKKRYAMLAERARLAEELKVIESGKTPDDLAKDETLTDRQHQDAVKLMFLEKFGDLSYTIDPAEVWAKAAEAEAFVVS